MRPVGWGIVGFGWVARDYALPAILASGHRLAAVHAADPDAAQAARAHGAAWHGAAAPDARTVSHGCDDG